MQLKITAIILLMPDREDYWIPSSFFIDSEMKPWPKAWTLGYGPLLQSAELIIDSKCDS
jgi:hypothetical protein